VNPPRRISGLFSALLAALLLFPGPASAAPAGSTTAKKPSAKSGAAKSGAKKPSAKATPSKKAPSQSASARSKSTRASTSKKKSGAKGGRSYSQRTPETARIQQIQEALAQRGYPCNSNGVWDGATVAALKKFQEDQNINNLTGRGKLDSLTLIALGLGPQRENPPVEPNPRTPATPQSPGQPEGKNE
jgi:hypothetical protein